MEESSNPYHKKFPKTDQLETEFMLLDCFLQHKFETSNSKKFQRKISFFPRITLLSTMKLSMGYISLDSVILGFVIELQIY